MTTGEFNREEWVLHLSRALAELAFIQGRYQDQLNKRLEERLAIVGYQFGPITRDYQPDDLQAFYAHACVGKERHLEERYGLLRSAFAEVLVVLARHPAWASLVDPADGSGKFSTKIGAESSRGSLFEVVIGLMARAMELRDDGFRLAASELDALALPTHDSGAAPPPGNLTTGYSVAVLRGLKVNEEIPILDDIALVPFERMKAFVNRGVLSDIAHNVVQYEDWESIAALIKPFRWTPEFWTDDRVFVSDAGLGGPFFDDAEAFADLLALFHASPIVCPATFPFRIHRTALWLLGHPNCYGGYRRSATARSFDRAMGAIEPAPEALDQARKAFAVRGNDRYRNCAPVIARLAEALARSGQFQTEDKILDVAIALERMYELDGGEISFKLKTRAAWFLETRAARRLRVFRAVDEFYRARSTIVHRRQKGSSTETKSEAFRKGFEVARKTVVALLERGRPPDWNDMVVLGSRHPVGEPRNPTGTTDPD